MNEPERQIMSILGEAVEYRSPQERADFLDKACAGDLARRARLEDLVRAYDAAGNFLQDSSSSPEPQLTADQASTETTGTMIGPYKLLEQIGEGGFGVVFMAEQTQPVRRKVALKVLKPGMDTKQVVARFEAERQALAIMDHPNIAKVFDGGATASGRPYFVMELVKGIPLTDFCDQIHFTPRQRLELFTQVCQAVQHAHQKGIIHRDLKPSNILVVMHDTTPVPKVIDFGIAKALGQELTDKTLFTGFAQMVGTPLYMSPEQAGQSGLDIDTRSDIYSLGVLLYELLTGTTPFNKERFKQAAYDEIRRIIREEEPPKPSTRLSDSHDALPSISAQRQTEPAKLTKLIRGELDWIVMKALEKDRNRRYETANGFAMDVQRYLADEPVQACPPSVGYRLRKFVRRNKGLVAALSAIGLLLLVIAIGSALAAGYFQHTAETMKELAGEKAELAKMEKDAREDAEQKQKKAESLAESEKQARKLIEVREKEARWHLYKAQMFPLMEAWNARDFGRLQQLLAECTPNKGQPDFRGWEWYYFQDQCRQASKLLKGSAPNISFCDVCRKSGRIAVLTIQQTIDIWDPTGTRIERTLPVLPAQKLSVGSVVWSPQGDRLACVCNNGWRVSNNGWVFLLDAQSGKLLHSFETAPIEALAAAWSPDGKKLAIGGGGCDEIKIWDTGTGKVVKSIGVQIYKGHFNDVFALDWHPDGIRLGVGCRFGVSGVWDTQSGNRIWETTNGKGLAGTPGKGGTPNFSVAWHPNGKSLASTQEASLVIYDEKGTILHSLACENHNATCLRWKPDGAALLSGGRDHAVKQWDAQTGTLVRTDRVHNNTVWTLGWSPDGKQIVSNSGELRVVAADDAKAPATSTVLDKVIRVRDLAWSPDGRWLACAAWTTDVILDADSGEVRHKLATGNKCYSLAWSPDSAEVAYLSYGLVQGSGRVTFWNPHTGKLLRELPVGASKDGGFTGIAWSNDGKRLATSNFHLGVADQNFLWDTPTWLSARALTGSPIRCLAFSPDSRILAGSGYAGSVLWDVSTGQKIRDIQDPGELPLDLAWSLNGRFLALARGDGTVHVLRAKDGKLLHRIEAHKGTVDRVRWSPDGRRLATCGQDGTVRIWDTATLDNLITLPCGASPVYGLTWSPDGRRLACACNDGTIRIWGSQGIPAMPKNVDHLETGILVAEK